MTLAVVVFAGALAVIASERVDRTKVALVGALLVVLMRSIRSMRSRRSTGRRSACSPG